jgi:hypothetical protein
VLQSQELYLDWIGIAETHLDTKKAHVKGQIRSSFLSPKGYRYAQLVFSKSDVDYGTEYKPGGVLQSALDNFCH